MGWQLCWLATAFAGSARAQHIPGYNYDEAKIAPYTMANPLKMADGLPVTTAAQWYAQRRPELMRMFEQDEFGRTPLAAQRAVMHAKVIEHSDNALGGLAVREQVELTFDPAPGIAPPATAERSLRLLIYLPKDHRVSPVVLGPNFLGNQAVVDDPEILPTEVWTKPKGSTELVHALPPDSSRGAETQEWQVKMLLERGYGLATFYYGDLEPDFKDSLQFSARELYSTSEELAKPDAWGSIGLWSWGLSRAMDYLQIDPLVDAQHVAVMGHSRLGKTADWAAAQDPRFAAVLSNESGHGGQSIQRRALGETVYHLEHSFPYWFAPHYAEWVGHDSTIPVDGNLLLSLLAPRPVYVGSAEGDEWSDPHGEFLSAMSASRVYRLLGATGLPKDTARPGINEPVGLGTDVAYHERSGKHDVTAFDWEHYLDFLDARWGKPMERAEISPIGQTPPPACAVAEATEPMRAGDAQETVCKLVAKEPATATQIASWRRALRKALFIPEPLPNPETKTYSESEIAPGVTLEKITFQTAYGLRVAADVYRPTKRPSARLPAMALVNGHGADKSSWYSYYTGILYARAGAVVLSYDPIGEGERNDEHKDFTGEHDQLIPSPTTMPVRLGGLMVTDAMMAVSALAERPDVDPHRIAVLGFSMGSFIASLTGAADSRVHALFVTGGGDLDGRNGYWDQGHAIMCQAAPYKALRFLGDRGAVLFTLSARRGDTFMLNGTADTVVAIPTHGPEFFDALRKRVVALNGSERGVFTAAFDPGASHRPSWVTPLVVGWLNKELQFPAWRNVDVATLPTQTIRAWAGQVGYALGKSSGREDRDAGIVALKADVPLLTAEQLDVFPRAEWEQRKSDFIYSSWLTRAAGAAAEAPCCHVPRAPWPLVK